LTAERSVESSSSQSFDVGAKCAQTLHEVLVAAVDVVGVVNLSLAVSPECGNGEGGTGTDVVGPHRGSREPLDAPDDRMVALGADVGAHAHQLVDVAEAAAEEILGDDPDPIGHRQHGDEERFVVGGHPRIRQRRQVDGAEPTVGHHPKTVGVRRGAHSHLANLLAEHVHVVGPGADEGHLASGDADCGHEGGSLHPVGDDRVLDRNQLLDSLDADRRGTGTEDLGPHAVQEGSQVGNLGLSGGVLDDGATLGQNRRHHHVLGCTDTRKLEHHPSADEALSVSAYVAMGGLEARAQQLEAPDVHVNGSGPEVITTRKGDARLAVGSQQWAHHHNRRPHGLDELVGRFGREFTRVYDLQLVGVGPRQGHAHRGEETGHDVDIGYGGDVVQAKGALGKGARRHELEHRVLGPPDGDTAFQRPAGPNEDAIHRPIMLPNHAVHAIVNHRNRSGPHRLDFLGSPPVTLLVHRQTATSDELDEILSPRDDAILAEAATGEPTVFHLRSGPFETYQRSVEWTTSGSDVEVIETFTYKIAVPFWRPLLALPIRRALRRSPGPASPWWAPPDRFDSDTARTVGLLAVAAIVTGYLGALIGQTATFASDEFGATDRAQGLLLAAVRVGTLITVVIMTAADRRGRKRLLALSLVAGCTVTVMGAASTGLTTLAASQAIARGFATSITLLMGIMAAEVAPRSSRAYLAAVLTLSAGLGAGIPVWFLFLADVDERGWRLLYLIALGFIPVSVWIARNLNETARFEHHASSLTLDAPRSETVRRDRLIAVAAVAFFILMFAAPASQFRNEFLRDERGFSAAQITLFVVATNTPQGIGVALAGKMADRRGRKPVASFTVGVGAVLTVLTYLLSGSAMWVAAMFAGMIAAGAAPALGVYGAELFGTGGRGRANGIVALVAVMGSATGLVAVGELSDRFGEFGPAFAIMALGPLLVIAIVLLAYPESANRELEDLNPS
jgi:MFS family permease